MSNRSRSAVVFLALVLIAAGVGWWLWFRPEPLPEGLIQANGRIEGDHFTVASRVPGRVVALLAREGDAVTEGQPLVRLDDAQLRARLEQARQAVAAAEAALQAEKQAEKQARRERRRLQNLLAKETASQQEAERAELAWQLARDRLEAARARRDQAQAAVAEVESLLQDLTIAAPAGGVITTRIVAEGEVVAPGSPLFDIVDLDRLYLKVYVPSVQIGKLRLGLPARVWVDAFPDEPFPAEVRYIASRAEFTPKEVQTPDERVKLVYAVKLYLDENPHHRLTPGLPADAMIRWQEGTPWQKPRW